MKTSWSLHNDCTSLEVLYYFFYSVLLIFAFLLSLHRDKRTELSYYCFHGHIVQKFYTRKLPQSIILNQNMTLLGIRKTKKKTTQR